MGRQGYTYILASKRNGTLYIGVTSDLIRRVDVHKERATAGFTSRYGVTQLVYYELHDHIMMAIIREKTLKKWRRAWKLRLIEEFNPAWRDLYFELAGFPPARE